jgi:hypothetical protein
MSSVASATSFKTCVIKLRRIGDATGTIVEQQRRRFVPGIGDVIQVSLGDMTVPARVVHVGSPDAEQAITIETDELSSSYVWDTFDALAQHEASEDTCGVRPVTPPIKPHPAFRATLDLVRQCHALARDALHRPTPDLRAALRHMRVARRAGWLAFPHIENEELRRRAVSHTPMSEAEWKELWPSNLSNLK